MTRNAIRQAIWEQLTKRPKKWLQVVDRAIIFGIAGWVGITAFLNNNAGILLLIIWSLLLGFLALYLTAKGR